MVTQEFMIFKNHKLGFCAERYYNPIAIIMESEISELSHFMGSNIIDFGNIIAIYGDILKEIRLQWSNSNFSDNYAIDQFKHRCINLGI